MPVTSLSIVLVLIATLFGAVGAVFFKKAATSANTVYGLVLSRRFIFGAAIYSFSSILYITALKFGDISIIYPIAALQYIWVCILAVIIFKEKMNALKWTGIILIVAGAALIGMVL